MNWRIERWGERGVTTEEAKTKREANAIAAHMRSLPGTEQTVVIKPNGVIRVCRNTRALAKR